MTTVYWENEMKDIEDEFGEYTGELTQGCHCELCTDNVLDEIRSEMMFERIRQNDEMKRMKQLYDAEVHYGIHVPMGAK